MVKVVIFIVQVLEFDIERGKDFFIRVVILEREVGVYIGPEKEVAYGNDFIVSRSLLCEKTN
jgi:hypothetical protein